MNAGAVDYNYAEIVRYFVNYSRFLILIMCAGIYYVYNDKERK